MRLLRWGIIGCGDIVRRRVGPALTALAKFEAAETFVPPPIMRAAGFWRNARPAVDGRVGRAVQSVIEAVYT
ncbi:MAG: hypothetical protein JJV98_02810 [Desulfosarcina sp.]|nr:hypothetical protein [Desulfobacterales bacterium]